MGSDYHSQRYIIRSEMCYHHSCSEKGKEVSNGQLLQNNK